MADSAMTSDLLALTAEIVAAHVANNTVAVDDLPRLIHDVHRAFTGIDDAAMWSCRPPAPPLR